MYKRAWRDTEDELLRFAVKQAELGDRTRAYMLRQVAQQLGRSYDAVKGRLRLLNKPLNTPLVMSLAVGASPAPAAPTAPASRRARRGTGTYKLTRKWSVSRLHTLYSLAVQYKDRYRTSRELKHKLMEILEESYDSIDTAVSDFFTLTHKREMGFKNALNDGPLSFVMDCELRRAAALNPRERPTQPVSISTP